MISLAPRIIQGDPNAAAGEYGRTAYHNQQSEQAEALQQKDLHSALRLMHTNIQYTPVDTVQNARLNEDGVKNLLGYSDEFIKALDHNHDGALDKADMRSHLEPMVQEDMDWIEYKLQSPKTSEEEKVQLREQKKGLDAFLEQAADAQLKLLDLPNKEGYSDGKVTVDEIAAKFVTQDAALQAIRQNYDAIRAEFKEKYPDSSWDWFALKAGVGLAVTQIFSTLFGKEPAFKTDGCMSGAERALFSVWSNILPDSNQKAMIRNYQDYHLKDANPNH